MALDEGSLARIRPFCSDVEKDVFALFGLPEEVIAVLFAYYSRSKDDLRTNLAKLIEADELDVGHASGAARAGAGGSAAEAKAKAFHEKWVVGYGHASVAEHACVHLAVEKVSILCAKAIEDLRLASFTEKSTRYVQFSNDSFVTPPELTGELRALHEKTSRELFETYLGLFPKTEAALAARIPRGEKQSEKGYQTAIHAQACDLLRGLLPAGTRTNLGFTANARSLAMLLCKMLASPLAEVREIAGAMHEASKSVSPTLVKYVAADAHRASIRDGLAARLRGEVASAPAPRPDRNHVRFVHGDGSLQALRQVALALAYENASAVDAPGLAQAIAGAEEATLAALIGESLSSRGRFDQAPRAFEAAKLTCELVLDYGAFRDLQRHRMLTQQVLRLGADLGPEIPRELEALGVLSEFRRALDRAENAWKAIAKVAPDAAQYVVPLAFRVRTLWTLDLRELVHVIELRSARQGHQSYRRMAHDLMAVAEERYPWLAAHVRVDRTPVHALARDEK
jgi:thymidylate synthase ThyX